MSWLIGKLTGGLIGGSGNQSQQNDQNDDDNNDNNDEQQLDESKQESQDDLNDYVPDWSNLKLDDGDSELCRASITFSVFQQQPGGYGDSILVEKSRHALLVLVKKGNSYDTALHIYMQPERPVIVHAVTSALWKSVDPRANVLDFGIQQNGKMVIFRCKFHSAEEAKIVAVQWSVAVWEHAQQDSFAKQVKDTAWVDDMEVESKYARHEIEPIPEDDTVFMSDSEDETDRSDSESEAEPEVAARHKTPIRGRGFQTPRFMKPAPNTGNRKNEKMTLGITSNRAYVGGGSQLGVFSLKDDGELDFVTNVETLKSKSGEALNPTQMMLHDQDSKMMMIDDLSNRVYEMDLERGQIINEYQAGDDEGFSIKTLGHATKYAQATGESTILGANNNTLFSIDPRVNAQNKIAQQKTYATKLMMNSIATTGTGDVAVGTDKGEIRLYNDISKIAKTRLPGLGDPIIGLDVTEDGEWILASTAYYLLLIHTAVDGQDKDGFSKSISNHARPPIKLQLSREDMMKYNLGEKAHFTTAHFDTGDNIREQWIIASFGPLVITWNFRKIKADPVKYKNEYTLAQCVENVVADQFAYGQRDKVVITTPGNVYASKRGLKTPVKASRK